MQSLGLERCCTQVLYTSIYLGPLVPPPCSKMTHDHVSSPESLIQVLADFKLLPSIPVWRGERNVYLTFFPRENPESSS
jgi:hypothetical protein